MQLDHTTRGLFAGGQEDQAHLILLSYITIASTGDAQDFGDLTGARDFFEQVQTLVDIWWRSSRSNQHAICH